VSNALVSLHMRVGEARLTFSDGFPGGSNVVSEYEEAGWPLWYVPETRRLGVPLGYTYPRADHRENPAHWTVGERASHYGQKATRGFRWQRPET
jgi:hypothetical protein